MLTRITMKKTLLMLLLAVTNMHSMELRFGYGGYSRASVKFEDIKGFALSTRIAEAYIKACLEPGKDDQKKKLPESNCSKVPLLSMNAKEVIDETGAPEIKINSKYTQPKEVFESNSQLALESERDLVATQIVAAFNQKQKVNFFIADELAEYAKSWTCVPGNIDRYTKCDLSKEDQYGKKTLECATQLPQEIFKNIRAAHDARSTAKNEFTKSIVGLYLTACKKKKYGNTSPDAEGLCRAYDNMGLYLGDSNYSVYGKVFPEDESRVFETYFHTWPDEDTQAQTLKKHVFNVLDKDGKSMTGFSNHPKKLDESTRCDVVHHAMPPIEFRGMAPLEVKCTTIISASELARIRAAFENKI